MYDINNDCFSFFGLQLGPDYRLFLFLVDISYGFFLAGFWSGASFSFFKRFGICNKTVFACSDKVVSANPFKRGKDDALIFRFEILKQCSLLCFFGRGSRNINIFHGKRVYSRIEHTG